MKDIKQYIGEALKLGKGTRLKYQPQNKVEMQQLVQKLYDDKTNTCDLSMVDTSALTDVTYIFGKNLDIKEVNVTGWDVSNFKHFYKIFEGCNLLERIIGIETWNVDASKLDYANLGFQYMFRFCRSLKSLDLSGWKMTGDSIQLTGMFADCVNLETVKGIDDWKITNSKRIRTLHNNMFNLCYKLKCDISKWPNKPRVLTNKYIKY